MDLYTLQVLLNIFRLVQIAMCLSKSSCKNKIFLYQLENCLLPQRSETTRPCETWLWDQVSHGLAVLRKHGGPLFTFCDVRSRPRLSLLASWKNVGLVICSSQLLQQADQKYFLTKASVVTEFHEFHWMYLICRMVFFMFYVFTTKSKGNLLRALEWSGFLIPLARSLCNNTVDDCCLTR